MDQKTKNITFSLLIVLILYLFLELSCFQTLAILKKKRNIEYSPLNVKTHLPEQIEILDKMIEDKTNYTRFDPDLGWTLKEHGSFGPHYTTNSYGLRSKREYNFTKTPGALRIMAFGDSFVHGDGVSNNSTFPFFLESVGNVEALNFGTSGYGLDQAYLKYQKYGKKFETDIVLICFMSENIYRHRMVYWPFYVNYQKRTPVKQVLPKPRFKMEHDELVLIPQPFKTLDDVRDFRDHPEQYLPQLGRNDFFYQAGYTEGPLDFSPAMRLSKVFSHNILKVGDDIIKNGQYNTSSESFQMTTKLIDNFVSEVQKTGALPIVIVFPMDVDFFNLRDHNPKRYEPLLTYLKEKQYLYIDMMDPLERLLQQIPLDQIIQGHYSPTSNKVVADSILAYILKLMALSKKAGH